jgi:hypothetical protein
LGAARGAPTGVLATPARSAGRAILVINATLYGGLVGYSIERASGSDDPRLLYPLLAVGAAVGLGGSIIVAEEWDVGVGDAWFLAAGAWWPTIGAHLIYEGRFAEHAGDSTDERWAFGLVGGTVGITIATLSLTYRGMGDGGAVVAHSGGALGLVFGGLTELAVRARSVTSDDPDIFRTPFAGMGYGAVLGWLAGSALATPVRFRPSRVLTVDMGAALGGLAGAALASPLLFNEPTATEQRGWLGATAGGALLGAGIAWFATQESEPRAASRGRGLASLGYPSAGILGESEAAGMRAPIYGLQWRGTLR